MLHLGPEHALSQRLDEVEGLERVTPEPDPAGVDVAADLTALPFDDASFDAAIASHVLEHVDDDRAAMGELARVLRPGGWVAVMVPIDLNRTHTYEDDSIVDPGERERAFWQHDHVRLYAPDIAERLQEAGLDVQIHRPAGELPAGSVRRHGLLPGELIFDCTCPPSFRA